MKTIFFIFGRFLELESVEIFGIIMILIAWTAICYLVIGQRVEKRRLAIIFAIISISAFVATAYMCSLSPKIPAVLIFLLGAFPFGFIIALLINLFKRKRLKAEIAEDEKD